MSKNVKAAIGEIVVETTWIEYVMAVLIARVEDDSDIMELLKSGGATLATRAMRAVEKLDNAEKIRRAEAWLKKAEVLRRQRNQIIHSIPPKTQPTSVAKAYRGLIGYQPREGTFLQYDTRELVDLAARIRECASEGASMADSDWLRPS
jgi:hypothetical protein